MSDTIAAIATAGGIGSIAIVRLSGADAITIARHIAPRATFLPRQADLASLYDLDGELIDQGIVLRFAAPHSFTGEEIVEFQCHGGRIIAEAILHSLLHHGARMAKPGEFSRRAFLGGKIDLSEAEAIAKMIEAQSTDAARILARQLKGELGRFVDEVRDALLRALAHSEVMIDYAEEVEDDLVHALLKQLDALGTRMERIVHSSRRRRGLIEGFRVAIIGKPNVGKSALLNTLLDYDRAIVSNIAGTTRDTIEEQVRIGTHLIRLIDTAGIRDSSDTIEQIGIERSLSSIEEADIVIALFDGSRAFDEEDTHIVTLLKNLPHPEEHIVAINKDDLPHALDTEKLAIFDPIRISTPNDTEPLIIALRQQLDARGEGEEIMLVSARQIEAVEACQRSIAASGEPLRNGELELFSFHLNEAIGHIGTITRPYENDEMLDRMFGDFCLGK
jgi:tRNA modification GTPase